MILPVDGQLALKMQNSTEITPIPGTEGAWDVVIVRCVYFLNRGNVAGFDGPALIIAGQRRVTFQRVNYDGVLCEGRDVTKAMIEVGNSEQHGNVVVVVAQVTEGVRHQGAAHAF